MEELNQSKNRNLPVGLRTAAGGSGMGSVAGTGSGGGASSGTGTATGISPEGEKRPEIRVRCPCCSKLYIVEEYLIKSANPEFDCFSCGTLFSFKYPPLFLDRVIVANSVIRSDLTHRIGGPQNFRLCPKCGKQVHIQAKECSNCQVIMEQVLDLPLDPSIRARPKLVKIWDKLLDEYENIKKHEEFFRECLKSNSMPYAIHQYQKMSETQPWDEISQSMNRRAKACAEYLISRGRSGRLWPSEEFSEEKKKATFESESIWKVNIVSKIYLIPFVMGWICIFFGIFSISLRNLVGFGVAMIVISGGLQYIFYHQNHKK